MTPAATTVRPGGFPQPAWMRLARVPRAEGWRHYEWFLLAVLLVAALAPAGAPTAVDLQAGGYVGLWGSRLPGGANLVELGLVILLGLWLAASLDPGRRRSALDSVVAALVGIAALTWVAALVRGEPGGYLGVDTERIALIAAAYFAVSRARFGVRGLTGVTALVAGVLAAAAALLVLRYGILGSTEFATSSGRMALLVTEDSLLLGVPAVLAWGRVSDRITSRRGAAAVVLVLAAVFVIELLSLRRGGMIFIGGALLLRALWLPRRVRYRAAAAALAAVTLALAVGPARPLLSDLSYAARSAVFATDDSSTIQREVEIRNFASNASGVSDLLLGRGIGAPWVAAESAPTDVASYGGGETALVRVGWHVYGLDWLYKVGLLGVAALLLVLLQGGLTVARLEPRLDDPLLRSAARSLALFVPVLLLFAFTNPRVAFFAGVTLGLLSSALDKARLTRAT